MMNVELLCRKVTISKIQVDIYLTIILRGRAGYQMIDNQRGA